MLQPYRVNLHATEYARMSTIRSSDNKLVDLQNLLVKQTPQNLEKELDIEAMKKTTSTTSGTKFGATHSTKFSTLEHPSANEQFNDIFVGKPSYKTL